MRTLTVSLTPEQAARLQSAIDGGSYASNSEIVHDALRLWERREDVRLSERDQLRQAYADGKSSGEGQAVDRESFLAGLKAKRSDRA